MLTVFMAKSYAMIFFPAYHCILDERRNNIFTPQDFWQINLIMNREIIIIQLIPKDILAKLFFFKRLVKLPSRSSIRINAHLKVSASEFRILDRLKNFLIVMATEPIEGAELFYALTFKLSLHPFQIFRWSKP